MSYDIFLFDPNLAPTEMHSFKRWFDNQLDLHNKKPCIADSSLKTDTFENWAREMCEANEYFDPGKSSAVHSIRSQSVIISISWEVAELAWDTSLELAQKHGLGVVETCDAKVWRPNSSGELECVFTLP